MECAVPDRADLAATAATVPGLASTALAVPDFATPAGWLPVAFMLLMGLAILAYVVLDGYDLGVGVLMRIAKPGDRNAMFASIGPFWDANETWLVLGIGLLLVAFPRAHGIILTSLYLPVAAMLVGLILRGVAFDFRYKARDEHQPRWERLFWLGSALAALAQGYMLGLYITGFARTWLGITFAVLIALGLTAGYVLLGACWLLIKTSGELQLVAVRWAQRALAFCGIGVAAVSVATPLVSARVFEKWFALPNIVLLLPIPVSTAALFFIAWRSLRRLPVRLREGNEYGAWVPFACTIGIFALAFYGLAYSLFPYIVIDGLTIWEAASAPESLLVILVGAAVVLPAIVAYTVFAYRVFRGKARDLTYG
jgi:cytochrome d ubiquinol oxidase subunit II